MYKIVTFSVLTFFIVVVTSCFQQATIGQRNVRKGDGILSKSSFFEGDITRKITSIQYGNFDSETGKEVAIFGQQECYIIDPNTRKIKSSANFVETILNPQLLNIKENGSYEIVVGGGGFQSIGLVDEQGKYIWKNLGAGSTPRMTAGDVDNDGEIEFYVSGSSGIQKLDRFGENLWTVDRHLSEKDIQIYDSQTNNTHIIVTRGNDGNIRLRNSNGKVISQIKPISNIKGLEIIKWQNKHYIVTTDGGNCFYVIDFNGNQTFKYCYKKEWFTAITIFRSAYEISQIRSVVIHFNNSDEPYLAVLTDFRRYISKSMLNIFTLEGGLLYQELIDSTRGINVVDNQDGSESLLVGNGNKGVWIYSLLGI